MGERNFIAFAHMPLRSRTTAHFTLIHNILYLFQGKLYSCVLNKTCFTVFTVNLLKKVKEYTLC